MQIGKEVHRQPALAEAPAGFAAAPLGIEAEPAGAVAADLGLAGQGEHPAYLVEQAGRRGRRRPRAAADRALIDLDELVDRLEPQDAVAVTAAGARALEKAADGAGQHVVDQRALPRAAHPRDACQGRQRNLGIDVLQVVKRGPADLDPAWTGRQALARLGGELKTLRQVSGRDRRRRRLQLVGRAGRHHRSPIGARAGPEIHDPVGRPDHRRVVLDDQHAVPLPEQPADARDQAVGIAGMKPGRRLVEDRANPHQARAKLRRQSSPLELASGERVGTATQ